MPNNDTRAISPNAYARRLGVNVHKIISFIRSGELQALNLATDRAGRPRWKLTAEAIANFERRRAALPQPKLSRRRRKKDNVIEFF
jgi:hypothetical protein